MKTFDEVFESYKTDFIELCKKNGYDDVKQSEFNPDHPTGMLLRVYAQREYEIQLEILKLDKLIREQLREGVRENGG